MKQIHGQSKDDQPETIVIEFWGFFDRKCYLEKVCEFRTRRKSVIAHFPKSGVLRDGCLGERRGVSPTCLGRSNTSGLRLDARQFDPALRLDRGHRPDKMSDSFQAIPMFGAAGIFSKLFVFGQLRPKTGRRLTAIHDSERRRLWLLRRHVPSAAHRSNVRE
jgi:hypothetical protein